MAASTTTVSALAQLRAFSECVADTADFGEVKALGAQDSTTNPSLLLKASEMKAYESLVTDAVTYAVTRASSPAERVSLAMDKLAVNFGVELLKIVPGVVSTEVDARLSFDTERSIAKGRAIIELYKQAGVDSKRVLVKLASTWEGLQASKVLEKEGIRTNMTLLFALPQAVAAAEAGSYLISPFVGRIYDWWIKNGVAKDVPALEDPGVKSVTNIYQYLKSHGYPTIVMGASFRNVGQIKALAGCDKLTISPQLLKELAQPAAADAAPLTRYLNPPASVPKPAVALDEATFRWQMNEDAMATEKLAEGIRLFAADCVKLEKALTARVQAHVAASA